MKITAIKQQIKRTDRYSVYIDEKYECSFSGSELLSLGLHNGQEINPTQLNDLKHSSLIDKGYMRALDLLSRRPRSEWELRDYLRRKDYDKESQDTIINKLSDLGYVNDLLFASKWIQNRRLLKPTSRRKLIQELKSKRVASEIIERALEADTVGDKESLKELVERKRKQTKYKDDLKLMQYLSRQGFDYHDIKEILK